MKGCAEIMESPPAVPVAWGASAALARLKITAFHDELTGLPNHRSLRADFRRYGRAGSPPVIVFFFDLDGFKAINDRYGHAAGDRVLREVAVRIREVVGFRGLVYRVGGDEFVAFVRSDELRLGESIAARVRRNLSEPWACGPLPCVSAGWASCPEEGGNLEALVALADQRMYANKGAASTRARAAG